jgi:hypothetical protein
VYRHIDDLSLDALHAAFLAELAKVPGIETGIEVERWQLYRLGRAATRSELDAGSQSWAAFHRGELERQREALHTVWSWYLAPFVPGMVVFLAGVSFTEANPAPLAARLAVFLAGAGLMAAVFAVIAWINGLAVKKIDTQIAALDHARE